MPRKFFRKFLPSQDSIRENRVIRLFGARFAQHNLWRLNRRSVAGGVAVGLFTGLIPGPFQMLGAVILALAFRVNLPVALFTTLYTNPFTFVPLYLIGYRIGALIVGQHGAMPDIVENFNTEGWTAWLPAFAGWLAKLGKPLLVGVPVLGLILAAAGYFAVRGVWRLYIVVQWRKRRNRRKI
ncbi:MAG: DUF2062 domain-containing protein [Sulfuricellaceae bacterium]